MVPPLMFMAKSYPLRSPLAAFRQSSVALMVISPEQIFRVAPSMPS